MTNAQELLLHARDAFRARSWGDAYARFVAADRLAPLDIDDLERLATAAYLAGADAISIDTWLRAYNECLHGQNAPRAARCTFWMILELLSFGDWARASGWLATAERLLADGRHDCSERGLLLVLLSRGHLKDSKHSAAHERSAEAAALADRFSDPDLKAFGRLVRGLAHARTQEVSAAVALFDEAMVAVTTSDVSPITVGVVYCAVIEACYEIMDLARAREWTAALTEWVGSQPDLVPFRGQCLVHRAETMRLCGEWSTAIEEARRACSGVTPRTGSDDAQTSLKGYPIGAAFYELAEICRMRGRYEEAREAYRQANLYGRSPEPGIALLHLVEGRGEAAATAIRRALDRAQKRPARAAILAACVEVMIATGDRAAARLAVTELATMAEDFPAPFLRATSARARGALLLAEGDPGGAVHALRAAWMDWQAMEIPYEAAQVRLMMGAAYQQLRDEDAAQMEFDAARRVFMRLEAAPEVARVNDLLAATSPVADVPPLTPRELQVIRLVAAGKTNKAIADELAISERTVDRHVSNILTKLDLPSRSAATAYAFQHQLV